MKYYTLAEVAALLGVDRSTLERRCKRLKITAIQRDGDARYKYLSEKDIERIRDRYAANTQHNIPTVQSKTKRRTLTSDIITIVESLRDEIATLRSRIDALEMQHVHRRYASDALRAKSDGLTDRDDESINQYPDNASSGQRSASGSARRSRQLSDKPIIPDGWVTFSAMAAIIGIKPDSLDDRLKSYHAKTGVKLFHTGQQYRVVTETGTYLAHHVIDPEQQEKILKLYGKEK